MPTLKACKCFLKPFECNLKACEHIWRTYECIWNVYDYRYISSYNVKRKHKAAIWRSINTKQCELHEIRFYLT